MVLSTEINYSVDEMNHGTYKFQRIIPLGTAPTAISIGGGESIEFELPGSSVFNLSKSVIRMGMAPTLVTAATASNKFFASTIWAYT